MITENSTVVALSDLYKLEADRVRREDEARRAVQAAEQAARAQAEHQAQVEAARLAAEQAAHAEAQRRAWQAQQREEQLRLQEAATYARAEQEARLREEQLRLNAQIRLSERRSQPKWPLLVVPLLLLSIAGVGSMWWLSEEQAEREAAELAQAEQLAAKQADALAAITDKLDALEAEQTRMHEERVALEEQLASAKDDEQTRQALEAKLEALNADIADNDRKQARARKSTSGRRRSPNGARSGRARTSGGSSSSSKASGAKSSSGSTGRKRPVKLGRSSDPLDGI